MNSTLGLVSDPDEVELNERNTAQRDKVTNYELNSLRVEISDHIGCVENLPSMTPKDADTNSVVVDSRMFIEHQNDEMLPLEANIASKQISQISNLSWSSGIGIRKGEGTKQTTLTFDVAYSQNWKFTQIESKEDSQETRDSHMVDLSQSSSICIKHEDSESTILFYRELSEIPTSIRNLYSSIVEKYCDYCFSYMLAAQLCQDEIPLSSYNQLKLSLLLSIASIQKSNQHNPFHVIALGADTSVSHLAMTSIGQLARRYMSGMFDPLAGGRVLEDNFVECGATTLARTGVCYIGDWSMQKQNNSARILREIESEQVIIENHPITYPLECAIWSCWNYTRKAKQDLSTIITFLNTFGIPIVQPERAPEAVMDFILEKSILEYEPDHEQTVIPVEDVRQFLAILFYQQVNISETASKLLSDYFVASRLNLPESLTQTSLSALHKLAEAHARLCFRNEANRLDAVVAIMICERFIHTIFSNPGNGAPISDCFETIVQLEENFYSFNQWLENFLKNINRS